MGRKPAPSSAHARRGGRAVGKSPQAGFSLASLSGIAQTRGFMVGAVVAACLVLSFMFLYGPAQQYYCSVRDHDKLAIEYAALSDRNNALQTDVDSLQTDAGIEQRAHDQLGWVKQGEESAKDARP